MISRSKAGIILRATQFLDEAEAAAAEAKVLGRAGRLTPGGLRAAIARAVIEVAPAKARTRREEAARDARVERWSEDSGNAALMGRELPPAEVLAADQRISWWAGELRRAGLDGDMDLLRARAYLDILLGKDSRPRPDTGAGGDGAVGQVGAGGQAGAGPGADGAGPGRPGSGPDGSGPGGGGPGPGAPADTGQPDAPAGPAGGPVPAGFAGRVTLTVPVATVLDLVLLHPARRDGPPGGYGTWRLRTPGDGPDLIVALDPVTTGPCDHRYQASGHDPGVKLRHLTQVRYATCTGIGCRRPAAQADWEHNIPYEAGGRTCMCNGGPKCRHDHRLKQHPRWQADQLPDGTFRWTTPAGRTYVTEPTKYPI